MLPISIDLYFRNQYLITLNISVLFHYILLFLLQKASFFQIQVDKFSFCVNVLFPRMEKSVQKIEMLKTCGGRRISRCFCSIIKCSTLKLHTSKCRTFHMYDEFSYAAHRLKRPNGQGGNYTVCRLKGNKNLLQCISLKLYPIYTRGRIFVVKIRTFQILFLPKFKLKTIDNYLVKF